MEKVYNVFEVISQNPKHICDGELSSLGVHHFDKEAEAGLKVGINFTLDNGITFTALFLALEIREAAEEGGNDILLLYNLGERILLKF